MSWIKATGNVCEDCIFFDKGYCNLKHITVKADKLACRDFDTE